MLADVIGHGAGSACAMPNNTFHLYAADVLLGALYLMERLRYFTPLTNLISRVPLTRQEIATRKAIVIPPASSCGMNAT